MKSGHGKAIPYHAMFDDAFRKDPFPLYAYLHGKASVIWDGIQQARVVSRADDVQRILLDAKTFSSNRVSLGRARFSDLELESLFDTIERLMLQRDEPDHTRYGYISRKGVRRTAEHKPIADRQELVCRKMVRRSHFNVIVAAWLVTVPAAAILSACLCQLLQSIM